MSSTTRFVLLAALVASVFARAAAAPITGAWQGFDKGRKAVSLEVRDSPTLQGSIVFYIVRDDLTGGEHDGAATPALPMRDLKWDGKVLRFSVEAGDRRLAFEMQQAGDRKAVLKRLATDDLPELTVELSALR